MAREKDGKTIDEILIKLFGEPVIRNEAQKKRFLDYIMRSYGEGVGYSGKYSSRKSGVKKKTSKD